MKSSELITTQAAVAGNHGAGDVDDAAPLARDHLRQQAMRELALAREIQSESLLPLRLARLEREAPAAAGVVHQDLHRPEALERAAGDLLGRALLQEVALDD